ncbi:hypothetical protein ES702_07547 [subsurface metagenome]
MPGKEEGISEQKLEKMIEGVIEKMKISAARERELKEMKDTIQTQEKEISDLKSFCDSNPQSPLCKLVDTKVAKERVLKLTSGKIEITRLPKMTEAIRKMMSDAENEQRTDLAERIANSTNFTEQDMDNIIKRNPISVAHLKTRAIENLKTDELVNLFSSCSTRGDCEQIYAELRRKGVNLQFKDEKKGRWLDAAKEKEEESKEGPHI